MQRFDPFSSEDGGVTERPLSSAVGESGLVTPEELSEWLQSHHRAIAERWIGEVRSRVGDVNDPVIPLLEDFLHLLSSFLGPGLGVYRDQVEALFQSAAELYGNLGGHRGQAAGESVEEFQLLREVILRFLHLDPPGGSIESVGLRELLQLNRLVDLGVTYVSIGHTDTLFFNLFQGAGVTGGPTPELLREVRDQVTSIRGDLEALVEHAEREASGRTG